MLAIRPGKTHQGNCTINVLPCRFNIAGASINASRKYWDATKLKDGRKIAYFRGRRLRGRSVRVPKGYRGVVVSTTEETLPKEAADEDIIDERTNDDEDAEIGILREHAAFDELIVWEHGALVDDKENIYVKGVEEWFHVAEAIHGFDGGQK